MERRKSGMEMFLAGWIVVLAANYLGGLNTGAWIPLLVSGTQLIALIVVFVGIRKLKEQRQSSGSAGFVTALAIVATVGIGILQFLSMDNLSAWMSIAALCLTFSGDVLFLLLTGLVLAGAMKHEPGKEESSRRLDLRYRWILFLTFDILYLLIQSMAVVLANENLPALTYVVPATGIPVLIAGIMIVTELYRIHSVQEKE